MKILWTVNGAIEKAATVLLNDRGNKSSGGWVLPYLHYLKSIPGVELAIVSSGDNKETLFLKDDNVSYYIIPGGHPIAKYDGYSKKNITVCESILETEKPDIIHIWGCESSLGIAMLRACDSKIPSVITIQGSGAGIDRYGEAGIGQREQRRIATLRDYLRRDTMWMQHRRYKGFVNNEKLLLQQSMNIIVENQWCAAICDSIVSGIRDYKLPLAMNPIFFSKIRGNDYAKHSIMCTHSYSAIKGHHMLFKALCLVKKKYPDVKLKIPGNKHIPNRLYEKLKESGYARYINQLISENGLSDSIEYLGVLSPEEMAEQMSSSNVFVMCSAIENQSSTLKEAMALGVPCVASDVGGVTEYARHRENALVYRFEDYELLASYICECFENEELCRKLSENARKFAAENWHEDKTVKPIIEIYEKVIQKHKSSVLKKQ